MPKREEIVDHKDQRAWLIDMRLVQGDTVVATVPTLEFSASWIKKIAKRHGGLCAHPTDLSCQLLRRGAEYLRSLGKLKGSGLEGL